MPAWERIAALQLLLLVVVPGTTNPTNATTNESLYYADFLKFYLI